MPCNWHPIPYRCDASGRQAGLHCAVLANRLSVVVGAQDEPIVTKIRALLKPKPLDEIRDPRERFDKVKSVSAAAGVKISSPNLDGVLAGAPLRVATGMVEEIVSEIESESQIEFEPDEEGIIIKADAIGSLEALLSELTAKEIPIKKINIGDVSRRDIIDTATIVNPLRRVLLAFNVKVLPDAKEELEVKGSPATTEDVRLGN